MVLDHLAAFPRLSSVHAFVPVHWHIWLLSAVHTLDPSGGYHWIFTVEVSLGISAFDDRGERGSSKLLCSNWCVLVLWVIQV